MKLRAVLLLLSLVTLATSCKSEYEERLLQGMHLKEKLAMMEQSRALTNNDRLLDEIREIHDEITLLARVSGNEELFLQQVFGDYNRNSWLGSQK